MSGDRRVRFRILHIIEAAEFVRQTLDGMTLDDFSTNRVVVLATLHSLQIAGEAANALPSDFTEKHAGFPWLELRDMRNVIVHQYFGINPDIIWDTVHNDFLPLEDELREFLASLPPEVG